MFSYHRAADTYLSASRKEAFSYGLLEAISQNVPVVVSDIEGTAWAQAYSKCINYPVEDPNACAKAIEQALALPADSNWEKVMEDFGVARWCERMMGIYDEVLK